MSRIITLIYGAGELRDLLPDVSLCHRIPGQRPGAEVPRLRAHGTAGHGPAYRLGPADALRRTAQRHGPPGLQAAPHERRVAGRRAQHLRPGQQPGAGRSLLAVAAAGRRGVGGRAPGRTRVALRRLRRRLGARPRRHLRHQPLRPVRPPASVAALPGTAAGTAALRHPDPLPHRAAPAVCGLAAGVLEHADDDRHAPALCGRDHGVHPRGHSARRTRPDGRAPRVRRLSPPSPDAGSGVAPATRPDGRRGDAGA